MYHPDVERALRAAGWAPGRQVPHLVGHWRATLEKERFVLHRAAESVLLEFGGLRITAVGPGVAVSSSGLNLDPDLAIGESDRFLDYFPELHNRSVFPVGESDDGHAFVGVDPQGVTYLLADEVFARWATFNTALDGLLRGVR